ncbi:MAG: MinD/ParA family protein [Anaerolineae bacterium]|nr:MinD/ParA family protein [Anaerolineae bacterium]
MAHIISVHSFRGGTGKSNTTANVSTVLAAEGLKVGMVDTDIQSPGIHVLFGISEDTMGATLNDYLWGKCDIADAAHDVTAFINESSAGPTVPPGQLLLVPSSVKAGEIARVLREGYDVGLLNDGFHSLIEALDLDVLMIDTHPGLNEETLLSIAISDALAIIMRPDQQDIQGTSVTVEVARKLDVPRMMLVVNKTPTVYDFNQVKATVEDKYACEVAAVLPHSDEMMMLASSGVFVFRYPDNTMTEKYRQIAARLMA